jgi:arabinose-5-phosphate isomerase
MKKKEIIEAGREVMAIESRNVGTVGLRLGDEFVRAVNLLCGTKTRVIVIGMGKSGLVGRKLAATLASCGTPAVFIHPAEAGHGDLGMLLKEDVVIAVSYSGETGEIVDLLDFFKRIGVKLVAITGNPASKIARYSDIVLDASVDREAGPGNIIPTASSTAALALGDALAVSVMRKKGFDESDFAFVHPKGQARRRLLKVKTLMRRGARIPRVPATAPMRAVIAEMSAKKIGMTCVVDDRGRLAGVITDGDLRRMLWKFRGGLFRKKAGDCMSGNPFTIDGNELATEALNIMESRKITSLIIKNGKDRVEGVVHLHDLWRTEMF